MLQSIHDNNDNSFRPFKLSEAFLEKYKGIKPPFGFNGLGEIVYMRSYSRNDTLTKNEEWWETCRRVVEGTYNMQKRHIEFYHLGWNPQKAQYSAQEMYDRMFNMKFLPPGRGIRNMGSNITEERKLFLALTNCSFISTVDLKLDPTKPFEFMMDMSMLGVGVGFDVKGSGQVLIKEPSTKSEPLLYVIPDSREGWGESLRLLLESYFTGGTPVSFSYSDIRGPGEPIRGFGGVSSGPEPLVSMHENIRVALDSKVGKYLDEEGIADIMNYIGVCVVSGGIRRTAQLMLGSPKSEDYLKLKDYRWDPDKQKFVGPTAHRAGHAWTANNSVFAELGMDYNEVAKRTRKNGEPGYIWLENMRSYSRMADGQDNKDHRVMGVNPCGEIGLEGEGECCNLVETFPARHDDIGDFKRTLKFAYLYSKTVTLGKTHWSATNRVMLRNRRIGCSVSGIQQFIAHNDVHTLKTWLEEGYSAIKKWDDVYSDWFAVPRSIKISTIKPSGTISTLAGATPGMHWPISRFQVRRVRMPLKGVLAKRVKAAGYRTEPDVTDPEYTLVAEIPIDVGVDIRPVSEVSMWEQLNMAAFLQEHWADNAVSSTITFDPATEGHDIASALNYFQYKLKGISFMPNEPNVYPQMPMEAITEEEYNKRMAEIKPINFKNINHDETEVERFCDGDTCII